MREKNEKETLSITLGTDNLLLRGMSLRNTEEVYGVIVYTGHETKIQMNTEKAHYKMSKIMKMTNRQIFIVLAMQIILASIGSCIGTTWMTQHLSVSYLDFQDTPWTTKWGLVFIQMTGTWVLIFT